jgi:hypothetical protein
MPSKWDEERRDLVADVALIRETVAYLFALHLDADKPNVEPLLEKIANQVAAHMGKAGLSSAHEAQRVKSRDIARWKEFEKSIAYYRNEAQ